MSIMTATRAFELPDAVSFRRVSNTAIFLDVARDRYVRLTREQSQWFDEICEVIHEAGLSAKPAAFAKRLVQDGLIRPASGPGAGIRECDLQPAAGSAYDDIFHAGPRAELAAAPRFIAALASSRALEARGDLKHTFDTVKAWKARRRGTLHGAGEEAARLAARFHALAPYFITAHDACRFRSLFLLRFLLVHGVTADWVFGVRLAPFRAHCWVEHDGLVLNDFHDQTTEFQKILSL